MSSVYSKFLASHEATGLALIHLGDDTLSFPHLVEPELLVPLHYVHDSPVGSTLTWEVLCVAAWEAVDPVGRYGTGPAFGAQVLAALGGNPHRAETDPRRHLRLALSALESFRGEDLPRHSGRAYLQLGNALRSYGRQSDALKAYERGRALLEYAGDDHGLHSAHARLSVAMAGVGLIEQSLLHAERGQQVGLRVASGTSSPGRKHTANLLHHRKVRALTLLGFCTDADEALGAWRHMVTGGYVFDLLETTAQLRLQQGREEEALEAFVIAIDHRFTMLDPPSLAGRSHYLTYSTHMLSEALGLAWHAGRLDLVVGILAALATHKPPPAGAPGSANEALRALDAQVAELARKATGAVVAGDLDAQTAHDDRARILLENRDEVIHALTGASGPRHRTTVEELSRSVPAAVRPGELLLIYTLSSTDQVGVISVADGAIEYRTVGLGAAEAEELAASAHEECARRTEPHHLHRLGEALLAPVQDLLSGVGRILVMAQGALADFPFHAAPFQGRPLVASAEVRALPSLAPLRAAGATEPDPGSGEQSYRAVVAAVGQPRYELLPALPALRREAEAVRAAFPSTRELFENEATAGALSAALSTCDVLHVAGHATFDAARPNLAHILLADRPLFAFEVACAARVPRLVNLSGCRAGAERRGVGGEGEGLASAFLAAGAEMVVAPLWPVRDDAALAFNSALYAALARPNAQWGAAVHSARLAVLARPEFTHPGLWGAFTVSGRL